MNTPAHVAALAFMALSLAAQARADDAKRFDVAVVTPRVERSAPFPGIVDATDERADRAPIVIQILSAADLPNWAGAFEGSPTAQCRSCGSPPTKPAKRR